jgi:uncharacterized protein YkwD
MHLKQLLALLAALALTACEVTLSAPSVATPTPLFVTATLPATRTPVARASTTPQITGTPAASITAPANCKDAAVLLADVTVQDGENIPHGSKFTKTWRLRNTGTCPWIGYKIAFSSGDRMQAPDTAPVPATQPKADVNVSVELTAPVTDGLYTGFYEMRNAAGSIVPIGIEKTFWVKITVGNVIMPTGNAPVHPAPTVSGTLTSQKPPGSCTFTTSGSYAGEIVQLINNARTGAGLPALSVNPQLAAAAQAHSINMACYSLRSHTGYDGSSIQQRVAAAGYTGSYIMEMIYGGYGAYPQTAFTWWLNDPTHNAVIYNTSITEIGAGYAYVEDSADGNYYTVDFGSQ